MGHEVVPQARGTMEIAPRKPRGRKIKIRKSDEAPRQGEAEEKARGSSQEAALFCESTEISSVFGRNEARFAEVIDHPVDLL
jgi:hypothetical protein